METNPSGSAYSREVVQLLLEFARLEPRMMADLPRELRHLKDRLPEVTQYRPEDYDAFLRVSSALYGMEDMTMSQLSKSVGTPLSTATRLMDWLVRQGYAQRRPDPEDRRVVRVSLTRSGRDLHEMIGRFLTERVDRLLSALTPDERRTFVSLLRKMKTSEIDC